MDEKLSSHAQRKSSSSGDKGKKTKKRKKSKAKDAKRNGKSSGTPDGETNSDSAFDPVRRKLSKSEGSTKSGTKIRKTKERKSSSIVKLNSPVAQEKHRNQCNSPPSSKPITLRAVRANLNLISTTNLIKTLNSTNTTLTNQNGSQKSGIPTSTNGGVTSSNLRPTSPKVVHKNVTSFVDDVPFNYMSIQEDEDLSSTDSEMSEVEVKINESLRWENELSDEDEEKDRIRTYKLNRRKRYLVELIKNRQDKESILQFARELSVTDDDVR